MIEWFKALFRMVRDYRHLDEFAPVRAVIVADNTEPKFISLPRLVNGFQLPEVVARLWKGGEPPELPIYKTYTLRGYSNGVALYEQSRKDNADV